MGVVVGDDRGGGGWEGGSGSGVEMEIGSMDRWKWGFQRLGDSERLRDSERRGEGAGRYTVCRRKSKSEGKGFWCT